ncbi:MAG: putative metal-binding motif-containing protein, partial [Bradymonadaceae bacterium]
DDGIDCTDDEYYDQQYDRCVPEKSDHPEDTGSSPSPDTGGDKDVGTDTATADTTDSGIDTTDTAPSKDTGHPGGSCDQDGDRTEAESCGGNDCDDEDPKRSPNFPERCDQIDNDCSGDVNDGVDCTFYAHESDKLFKINPFEKTATNVGANLPGLHDLDTHPDGTLYGVTPDGFYRFDEQSSQWTQLKKFSQGSKWAPADPNGMAINRNGKAFVTAQT